MIVWTSTLSRLRETRFEGYFENVEPLRIGAGREPPLEATIDLAILKIKFRDMELPYIPGSSLKGVFRSVATSLATAKGFKVCSGLSRETCMDTKFISDPKLGKQKLGKYIEIKLRQANSQEAMHKFFENACLMCKIFGAPSYRGKVYFSDAYPLDQDGNPLAFRISSRVGIAIDRRTGAVYRRALYNVEYVEPGALFRFNINCFNLPNYALGLLATVLRMINQGAVKIGGFKTRGFGAVKIKQLKFANKDISSHKEITMKKLDTSDSEVNLQGLAKLANGWLVAEDERAWQILSKLEEVWASAGPKGSSS